MQKSIYKIYNATLNDIAGIKGLAAKHTKELGFILRPALEEAVKRGELLCAKDFDCNIAGFCHYHRRRDGVSVIYEICVNPEVRGGGLGLAMINRLPRPVKLKCPEDNESNGFYKHIGCKLLGVEKGKKRKLNVWCYV